jgi:hypothetical protein
MINCNRFESCNAPLCPLDTELTSRVWYPDEDVCKCQKHNKHRWIKKQRSIVRRQTKSYLDRPITYQELYDSSRPRQLTGEMINRLALMRAKKTQQTKLNPNE